MLRSAHTALVLLAVAPPAALAQEPSLPTEPAAFVTRHCATCHGATDPEASLDLVALAGRGFPSADEVGDWLAVRDVLESGEMPPKDEPRPDAAETAGVLAWIGAAIERLERSGPLDPGRVTMRRLSRVEYRNSIRDLFGVEVDLEAFPRDDLGYGFDNVGDALTLSTLHLEKYAAAAERVVDEAFPDHDPEVPPIQRLEAETAECTLGERARRYEHAVLLSRGTVTWRHELPRRGDYRIRIHAHGDQAGDEPARMAVAIDEGEAVLFDVPATSGAPGTYVLDARCEDAGIVVSATFVNDFYRPDHPDRSQRDRNLVLDWCEIEGPLDHRPLTWAWQRLLRDDPGRGSPMARARPMLTDLLERAWRRPVRRDEVTRLARLVHDAVEAGESFESGMRWAIQAMLVSPHFLFRVERGGLAADTAPQPLEPHALATRLAYFLWSSTPDDRLLELARSGELSLLPTLVTEAKRMLADARSDALAENFAAQWLELRSVEEATRDPEQFPTFGAELARDMRTETELFFDAVRRERLPVRTLLDADFTFVNERLARHYDIDGVRGPHFRRIALPVETRGGLLTHASVLTVTSNATRTSPVRRGKWILENVLDAAPPPPPPGTDSLVGESEIDSAATMREQLALHRAKVECAVCHDRMDALGFTLENFDAIGRWRSADGGGPIDASGTLPDGRVLDGPVALRAALRDEGAFVRTLARKLFVYGIGRAPSSPDDALAIERLLRDLPTDPTIDDVVLGVVQLEAFRRRRLVDR